MNGTWQDTDNSGASGLFNNLNFNGITAGDYRFLYTTSSAILPCPESQYSVTVTVIDCTCPDVDFQNAGALCNAGDVLDMTSIELTAEPGSWSILQAPAGGNPAILTGNMFDPTNSDIGDYTLQFTLLNQPPPGCPLDFQVTVHVDAAVDAGSPNLPVTMCSGTNQMVNLADLITGEDSGGTWTETSVQPSQGGAFNAANGTFRTDNQSPGTYTFNYFLSGSGSCPDDDTDVSVVIHPLPTVVIAGNVVIDCANPIQSLDANGSSSGPGYVITWTGPGLVMDGTENTLSPLINQAGLYTLTIEDAATGCSNAGSVTVTANTDPPTGAVINARDPACFGDENGFIQIVQIIGGAPPYSYMLNNGAVTGAVNYGQLSAGDYTVVVVDANGCRWDTMLTLIEPAAFDLDIGPDLDLGLGEHGTVHATVDLSDDQIDVLIWQPDNIIECLNIPCLDVNVYPFVSTTLTATVIDTNGCESSDQIQIKLNKIRHVFIPSVFSPNGDGNNDIFFINGDPDQIITVKQFRIFDRWGAVVHEVTDFAPNDPNTGWDGHGRNGGVNPGVFTYMAEIEFIDQISLMYYGDVTVVK
jgi:gliding motility-associated-like protein